MATGGPDFYTGNVLYGASGGAPNGVSVDSAGNLSTIIKGMSGSTIVPLQVDTGALTALLKAAYGSVLKTVACDSTGRITVDISAQSATRLATYNKPPPTTGAIIITDVQGIFWQRFVTIPPKCTMLHFRIQLDGPSDISMGKFRMTENDVEIINMTLADLASLYQAAPSTALMNASRITTNKTGYTFDLMTQQESMTGITIDLKRETAPVFAAKAESWWTTP